MPEHESRLYGFRLLILFVALLLVFVGIRWDKAQWLEQKLIMVVQQQHLPLVWGGLKLSGATLELSAVQWQDASLSVPVELDSLAISPAWGHLLQAEAAAHIELLWQGNPVSLVVSRQDVYTQVSDLQASLNIASIRPFFPIDAELVGEAVAQGDMLLDSLAMPLDGAVTLSLHDAMITAMGVKLSLAEAELTLQHDQQQNWKWGLRISGDIKAEGSGELVISSPQPQSWQLAGGLSVAATPSTPPLLLSMIQSAGVDGLTLKLSGVLGQIRTQPL